MEEVFSPQQFRPEAAIIANGELPPQKVLRRWTDASPYIVCCDGAAAKADAAGIEPSAIIGDGDSISPETLGKYTDRFIRVGEQETNDLTKAVRFLAAKGLRNIVILGATGRREDHTLGNISLLAYYRERGITALMPTPYGVFIPCHGDTRIEAVPGQEISVFNCNARGMRSSGLEYECRDFSMLWQGTLNVAAAPVIGFSAKGCYLVYLANPD